MDGLEATAILRKNPRFQALPIIAMTANVMQQDRDTCLKAGMNDHVAKPISPEILLKTVLKWLPARSAAAVGRRRLITLGSDSAYLLDGVPNFDATDGMRRSLGKWPLYSNLLRRFIDGQREAAGALRKSLTERDLQSAERMAHSLKGVAGQIGAIEIAGMAAELERKIKAEAPYEQLLTLTDSLGESLARLIGVLDRRLKAPAFDAVMDPEGTHRNLARFDALLEDADAEAVEFLEEHRAFLRGFLAQDYWALEQSVKAYDFDAGLEILRRHSARVRETEAL